MSGSQITNNGWLQAAVAIVLSALTGTVAGAKYGKKELTDRLDAANKKATEHAIEVLKQHGEHEARIRVVESGMLQTVRTLDKIDGAVIELNKNVLLALMKGVP